MYKNNTLNGFLLALLFLSQVLISQSNPTIKDYSSVTIGAAQFDQYLPKLKNKRVAVLTNVTGLVGKTSIVDTLLKLKVKIKKIFGPEHGFRSDADAGETPVGGLHRHRDRLTGRGGGARRIAHQRTARRTGQRFRCAEFQEVEVTFSASPPRCAR